MNVLLRELVFHASSSLTDTKTQMRFAGQPQRTRYPSQRTVNQMHSILQNSTCAVVGASRSLFHCPQAMEICSHDVVIRVNHHMKGVCNRTDVQVVNAFACIHPRYPCERPRLFRFRTEWNDRSMAHYQKDGAWLSNGFVTNFTQHVLTTSVKTKSCCGSAGGSAVAFAIHACRAVTIFGLGDPHTGYLKHPTKRIGGVHNLKGEDEWYDTLQSGGRIVRRCSAARSSAVARSRKPHLSMFAAS